MINYVGIWTDGIKDGLVQTFLALRRARGEANADREGD